MWERKCDTRHCVQGDFDKSLARPRRNQATVTKVRIYSTYSTQSSIHFLAHALTFASHSKKNAECCLSKQVCAAAMTSALTKNGDSHLFFHTREQVVFWLGQIWRIGWVIKTLEAQLGQFLLGCKCPVSRGVVQEQDPLGDLPAAFSFKMSFNCTSRDE